MEESNERAAEVMRFHKDLASPVATAAGIERLCGHLKRCADRTALTFSAQNQRDEEQHHSGIMCSRLPGTACILRLIALCVIFSHTAAYFGSVSIAICYLKLLKYLAFSNRGRVRCYCP